MCGIPAGEIARFARAYASAKPAMLLPGFSIQRVFAGEESFRLTVALPTRWEASDPQRPRPAQRDGRPLA